MATLAHKLSWKDSRDEGSGSETQTVVRAESEPAGTDLYLLRPLPNEDVYLYIKRFDNTGVRRQADPGSGRTAWKAIGGSFAAAALVVGLLLPGAYRLLAGYQLDRLKQVREQSLKELRTLEWEEARLLSIERMQQLAKTREFAPPSVEQVQFIQPKDSLARLQTK